MILISYKDGKEFNKVFEQGQVVTLSIRFPLAKHHSSSEIKTIVKADDYNSYILKT